jgi:23S rRNA-/tRNA-specific pseudouridylate synthase
VIIITALIYVISGICVNLKVNHKVRNNMQHNFKDLSNMKFGKWTVLERGINKNNKTTWTCLCDCGRKFNVLSCHLISGNSVQCRICADTMGAKRHGDSASRFYRIWEGMKNRCKNKTASHYENYGGRGITVCTEWEIYKNFKHDMYKSYLTHTKEYGEEDTTLDRIDTNSNYELNNCRWQTRKEQANNRSDNTYFEYNNQNKTISQWCDELVIDKPSVYMKIYKGIPIAQALNLH